MSTTSPSPSDIIVAWATPVSLAQLGARLFAYVETKAAITTFRLVARDTTVTACHCLPEEIKALIASKLRDIVFRHRMKEWVKISKCLADSCTTMSHVPEEDIQEMAWMGFSKELEDDTWVSETFFERAAQEHQEDIEGYCNDLIYLNGRSRLAKCVRIFNQDFGIRPYFVIHKSYDQHNNDIKVVIAKAYLTLPLLIAPISSNPAPGSAIFSVGSTLNPAALIGPTEDQLLHFTIASNVLKLRIYDPNEDETAPEDEPSVRYSHSSDEDTASGGCSRDDDHDGEGAVSYTGTSGGLSTPGQEPAREVDSDIETRKERGFSDGNGLVSPGQGSRHNDAGRNGNGIAIEMVTGPVEEGTDMNAGSEEQETWPQLMILGCGELDTRYLEGY